MEAREGLRLSIRIRPPDAVGRRKTGYGGAGEAAGAVLQRARQSVRQRRAAGGIDPHVLPGGRRGKGDGAGRQPVAGPHGTSLRPRALLHHRRRGGLCGDPGAACGGGDSVSHAGSKAVGVTGESLRGPGCPLGGCAKIHSISELLPASLRPPIRSHATPKRPPASDPTVWAAWEADPIPTAHGMNRESLLVTVQVAR
jgi:hypothetical protein